MDIKIPAEKIPVIADCDICVIGGSCTGVFAAARAARLGAKVVLVEKQNRFGGVATSSLVNMWHSIYDTDYKNQIIAGLTVEMMERLDKRGSVAKFWNSKEYGVPFNSEEMTIELDELVLESGVTPMLHTWFSSPVFAEEKKLDAILVQNKDGRRAIKAKYFVDASGDADLCQSAGLETYTPEHIQPPTTCAKFENWLGAFKKDGSDPFVTIRQHMEEFDLPEGFMWGTKVLESEIFMLSGTRVAGRNPAVAADLTFCEMEGRRQIRKIMDIFRKYSPGSGLMLHALPSLIGMRESRHVRALSQIKGDDLLHGRRFDDAIANGTYPVDVHHQDKPGITFKNMDGSQHYCRPGMPSVTSRWRGATAENPKFYQIPLRCIIPRGSKNIIMAGRMLDADQEAFGAARVMVNLNQTGEAAGVAAWLALSSSRNIADVPAGKVRETLAKGGSAVI